MPLPRLSTINRQRLRALLIVPCDRLSFTGTEPRYHQVKAESGGTMRRYFCTDCGSPVSIRRPETPQIEFICASSLDEPSQFVPCEVWMSRALPWHHSHLTWKDSTKVRRMQQFERQ